MGDPEDPGGTAPDIGYAVTIDNMTSNTDVSIDTDCSIISIDGSVKRRKISSRICKHCNKRRRKHGEKKLNDVHCHCSPTALVEQKNNDVEMTPSQDPFLQPSAPQSQILQPSQPSQTLQPSQPLARMSYVSTDISPFIVHIQKKVSSPDENVQLKELTFGQFLKKNSFKNIIVGSLKRIGRNRITIEFRNYQDANAFLNSPLLEQNNYKAFIPTFSITRMGVIRGIPVDWSEDDIMNNIEIPSGCGKVIKVRRLKRKILINNVTELKCTESVVVTFDGQVLPPKVYACYTALPVDVYIYPTVQCYNCCRFGHVKMQCRSRPRCFRCGHDHTGDSCSVEEEHIRCVLCKGLHMATSNKCLEFLRQKRIKETMAKSCISYAEASKQHAPISKISYADALISSEPAPQLSNSTNTSQSYLLSQPPPQSTNISYRKTVNIKPKTRVKSSGGYDVSAHRAITKDYNMQQSSPNGSALKSMNKEDLSDASLKELIIALMNTLSQSKYIQPSNAALIKNDISQLQLTNINGSHNQHTSVELPQSNI